MIPPALRGVLGEKPGGVFYLHGEDEFRKAEASRALIDAHLDPGTRDFNMDRLRGSDVNVETLASVLGTPPMMAEWRVVVLSEVEQLAGTKRSRDLLLGVAAAPPAGLALILLCTVPARSSARFYKDLEKRARALEFGAVSLDDVPGWLIEEARGRHDRELDPAAARALAAGVGTELAVLARELEKLDTLTPPGDAITLAEVEAAGTRVPRQDRWAWFDLVAERRFPEALEGLHTLLQHGESGVGLTIGLATHFLRLGVAASGGAAALQEALPPHQRWLSRRVAAQARKWNPEAIDRAVRGLLLVDRLLKSSPMSERHLMESWLLERATESDRAAA
jgi:DNA polymerase III subunit delta